jgi:hypothetical protein
MFDLATHALAEVRQAGAHSGGGGGRGMWPAQQKGTFNGRRYCATSSLHASG